MTTYAWPYKAQFLPQQYEFGPEPGNITVESVLNRSIQTSGVPGKRWAVGVVIPATSNERARAELEGFLDRLNGQEHRVSLWNWSRIGLNGRGTPAGTITTTGVKVKTTAAQFATSMVLKNCGAGATLLPGDMFSVNGQLLMNDILRTADGSGDLTVPVSGGLREQADADDDITLIRPTATFILRDPNWRSSYVPGMAQPMGLDFIEVYE